MFCSSWMNPRNAILTRKKSTGQFLDSNYPEKNGPEIYWKGSRKDTDVHADTDRSRYVLQIMVSIFPVQTKLTISWWHHDSGDSSLTSFNHAHPDAGRTWSGHRTCSICWWGKLWPKHMPWGWPPCRVESRSRIWHPVSRLTLNCSEPWWLYPPKTSFTFGLVGQL